MFGLLAGGRGIGNVISGPLSAALIERGAVGGGSGGGGQELGWGQGWEWGFSSEYGTLILFTGVTALLGGVGVVVEVVSLK